MIIAECTSKKSAEKSIIKSKDSLTNEWRRNDMRKGAAFRFIPELLGDFEHVMELSGNPKLLYVDTAVNTLHAASDVFQTFEEYGNTKRKKETLETIKKKYKDLEGVRLKNYQDEEIRRIDIEYEKVKNKIRDGQFRDKEVRSFIQSLEKDLKKI